MDRALLFDSHCHLDDEQFDADREELIASLPEQGIACCVTVGSDLTSSEKNIALASQHDFLYAAAGVHPHAAAEAAPDYLDKLRELLKMKKVVALGEIGLDYHYDFSPRDMQRKILIQQLDLACELDLPVIIHVREAHGDMLDLLRDREGKVPRGVIHCFSGSAESALEYVRFGMYVSFSGSLTFKNARKLRVAAKVLPDDRVLIETDSPYLSPEPMRGRRNTPANLRHTCALLAEIRGIRIEEAAELTANNAKKLFGLV